jgi:endonuclease/exonuclease/phosphatase family metal-dependent hydrolase
MQRFVLSFLLIALTACTDSGSTAKRPDLPDAPAQQPLPPPAPVSPTPAPLPAPTDDDGEPIVPQLGDTNTFEFGTWNIENFPKSDRAVDIASDVVKQTDVDVMALEEVASEVAFQQLLDELPGFSGVLSPHQYGPNDYQKLAFIYRQADLELVDWELLFVKQNYSFPRPPLQAHFKIKTGSRAGQDIYLIAVHLKATTQDDSLQRREAANKALEAYVADLTTRVPGAQVTLLGDFNERVTWTEGLNVFRAWTDKPESYTFQTKPLALAGEYTFISPSRPMLDHMISTRNVQLNPITIPKLENMIPAYRDLVSDHLPVMARLP